MEQRQCPMLKEKNKMSYTHPWTLGQSHLFIELYIEGQQGSTQKKKIGHISIVELSIESSQCHPAAAEGAKLSKIRRGQRSAWPTSACRISSESCALIVNLYMSWYILHAKAIHNISAYIESSMTSKKSYLKPPNPPSTGPWKSCFQKSAKTRGPRPLFSKIRRFTRVPRKAFHAADPCFLGAHFWAFFCCFDVSANGVGIFEQQSGSGWF